MNQNALLEQAMALPLPDRVSLAQALWQSIADENAPELTDEERTVFEIALKRDAELSSGAAIGRTHEEVMQAARQALRCR